MKKYLFLLKNILFFSLSGLFVNVVTFFLLPLYTFYLSTEEYAIIDLVTVTQQLLLPLLTLSLCDAVLRFVIEAGVKDTKKIQQIFSVGVYCVLIGSIIVVLGSKLIRNFFSDDFDVNYFIIIYIFTTGNYLLSNFLRAIDKVKSMVIVSGTGNIITIILNVVFIVQLNMGLDGYMCSYIIGQVIIFGGYCVFGKIYDYAKLCIPPKDLLYQMLMYSIPLVPNSLFWWINSSLDKYFLTSLAGLGVVGLYSVASKIPSIVTTLNGVFQQAWNLSAFKEFEDEQASSFYNKIYEFYQVCIFGIVIALIAGTQICAKFLFSKDFFDAWIFVPWLVWGASINAVNAFWGSIFTAAKKTKVLFITTGLGAGINIILNYVLIQLWSGTGAAIATLVSYIVVWFVRVKYVQNLVKISIAKGKLLLIQGCILIQIILLESGVGNPLLIGIIAEVILVIIYYKQLLGIIDAIKRKYLKR